MICQIVEEDSNSTTLASTEAILDYFNDTASVNKTEVVPSSSESVETVDHTHEVSKPDSSANTFLWRLLTRMKLALAAFPVYVFGATFAYVMSFDACDVRTDDFWLQQYCMYGHYFLLGLLILFAPIWFVIGPFVFFIFMNEPPLF